MTFRPTSLRITRLAVAPVLAAGWPPFRPPHEATCRVGEGPVTVRQFLVQDPDGHLLRFAEDMDGA